MLRIINTEGAARACEFHTAHGVIETPVFMNIGTAAAIKGAVSTLDLHNVGCRVQLSNAYHLHLRPGDENVRALGGLHGFMNWDRPILTDSGGFQLFSLARLRRIKEEGVYFSSHIDGRAIFMGPEESIRIQSNLGSTIAMAFDECVANPSPHEYVSQSADRTIRWLKRCIDEMRRLNSIRDTVNAKQMLFGINQGGIYHDIRRRNMTELASFDLDGYAIGGLAVGESSDEMYSVIEQVEPLMPRGKPRYLMGVGTPENIVEAVYRGVDFFDCVIPTRNARHATVYTDGGILRLHNARYKTDAAPLQEGCECEACARYSRAYIHHLFKAKEMLALRLCVLHNLTYYNRLMRRIRDAILDNRYASFRNTFYQERDNSC